MIKPCIHCETPTQTTKETDLVFCCAGCLTVYHILNESHMTHYYELKKTAPLFSKAKPITPISDPFDYLDTPDALQKLCTDETRRTMAFFVEGIHCVACIWLIENLGRLIEDVSHIQLNLGNSQLTITRTETGSFGKIASLLNQIGYYPHPLKSEETAEISHKEFRKSLVQIGIAGACAANIMMFSVVLYSGASGDYEALFQWACGIVILPSIFYAARPFYKGAWTALKAKQITIDVPVILAIILGTSLSFLNLIIKNPHIYFDSLSVFIFLLLSTRLFFKTTYNKLDPQKNFIPLYAKKIGQGNCLTESLKPNDIIEVSENSIVPVDGILISPIGYIDAHIITGESDPLTLKSGSDVFAGMKNCGDRIEIQVTQIGADTRIGKIISQLKTDKKPKIVLRADRIAKKFLVFILGLGSIVLIWKGLDQFLALIILACPCALSLATPLLFSLSIRKGAEEGICIKNPDVLEKILEVDTCLFDKTGTLTEGQYSVLSWEPDPTPEVSNIVYQLEKPSRHPIAKALIRHLSDTTEITLENRIETIGKGISATYQNNHYELKGIPHENTTHNAQILTHIALYKNTTLISEIELGDKIIPSAKKTIESLHKMNIHTHIISGDQKHTVEAVQKILNIQNATAKVSPEDKEAIVKKYPRAMMIGDGANDAAALNHAFVSVAVQGSIEISLKAADIYLSVPGIDKILRIFEIGKKTNQTAKLTLYLSLLYNGIGIVCVLCNIISPLLAAVLMPLSSISVFLVAWIRMKTL